MKTKTKRLISLILSLALIMGFCTPALAANESNTLGVTFSATLDQATLAQSDADQTITMYLRASQEITLDGMGLTIVQDSPLQLTAITGGDERIDITASNYNLENGKVGWSSSDAENVEGVTDLLAVTFTVPAGTAAGTYHVGVEGIELSRDYGDVAWETTASATAVLTITGDGYVSGLSTLTEEVSVTDVVKVNVGVSHSSDMMFAAGEIVINYDSAKLAFDESASTLGSATVSNSAGVLTLEDYGADKSFGTGVYVLAFEAISDGAASVTLVSAAFVDKEGAVKSDLISATLAPASITLTINKQEHSVTLPDIFVGSATVTDGDNYTFSQADGKNYNYGAVTATVNGAAVMVVDNGDGTYTIENVTGDVEITGTRTEKTYSVTFTGNAADEIIDGAPTATYNTDYTFTMPSADGWAYSLDEITIGGTVYTGYTVENLVYTIPGAAIKGDIQITVNKSATIASVTVEGTGAGAAAGYEPTANIGESYTLTIAPEAGYSYTVSATMGGESVEVIDNEDNTYTIQEVTDNVIFTVTRIVVVDGVSVERYLTLDGTVMWLVKNDVSLAENKVPTYNGEKMFWSNTYNAYCYLAIAPTLSVEEAAELVDIIDGDAVTVDYGMDVNITGKVDASDAQLTYNMYNAVYSAFSENATMEKFLRADVNGDSTVDVKDAASIIDALLFLS